MKAYEKQCRQLVDDGVEAIYLWGVRGDQLAEQDKGDLMARAVEILKKPGIPSCVGAHKLDVIQLKSSRRRLEDHGPLLFRAGSRCSGY